MRICLPKTTFITCSITQARHLINFHQKVCVVVVVSDSISFTPCCYLSLSLLGRNCYRLVWEKDKSCVQEKTTSNRHRDIHRSKPKSNLHTRVKGNSLCMTWANEKVVSLKMKRVHVFVFSWKKASTAKKWIPHRQRRDPIPNASRRLKGYFGRPLIS